MIVSVNYKVVSNFIESFDASLVAVDALLQEPGKESASPEGLLHDHKQGLNRHRTQKTISKKIIGLEFEEIIID